MNELNEQEIAALTIGDITYYLDTYAQGEVESALCEDMEKNNADR